jgi:hypothetical protein
MFATFANDLACYCESRVGGEWQRPRDAATSHRWSEEPCLELAEPVRKRKQGILALRNEQRACNQGVDRGYLLGKTFQTVVYYREAE